MAAGSLTFGGNMSIALGPLGRNGEATGAINTSGRVAAMSVALFSPKCVILTVSTTMIQVQLFKDQGPLWRCLCRRFRHS